jgi:hypothetical protein
MRRTAVGGEPLARPLVFMIIFINDDRAYLNWVTHHRQALVLEGRRWPKVSRLKLHRAVCPDVKAPGSRRAKLTTGGRFKACSTAVEELQSWATQETGKIAEVCERCHPDQPPETTSAGEVHLSRLAAEILDYVLDATLIHMEHEYPPYRLAVSDIAACFAKTPAQIGTPLRQLVDDGLVIVNGKMQIASAIDPKRMVWPTLRAMRTLEAFQAESDESIHKELAKLGADSSPVS